MSSSNGYTNACITQLEWSLELCDISAAQTLAMDWCPSMLDAGPTQPLHIASLALFLSQHYKHCLKALEPYEADFASNESLGCIVAQCWANMGHYDQAMRFMETTLTPPSLPPEEANSDEYARSTIEPAAKPILMKKHDEEDDNTTINLSCEQLENTTVEEPAISLTEPRGEILNANYPRLAYLYFVVTRTRLFLINNCESSDTPSPWAKDLMVEHLQSSACTHLKRAGRSREGCYVIVLLEQLYLTVGDVRDVTDGRGFSLLFINTNSTSVHDWGAQWLHEILDSRVSSHRVSSFAAPLVVAARVRKDAALCTSKALHDLERHSLVRPCSLPLTYTAIALCLKQGSHDHVVMCCVDFLRLELDTIETSCDDMPRLEQFLYKATAFWALGTSFLVRSLEKRSFALVAQKYIGRAVAYCFNLKDAWVHLSNAYQLTDQWDQAVMSLNVVGHLLGSMAHDEYQAEWRRLFGVLNECS